MRIHIEPFESSVCPRPTRVFCSRSCAVPCPGEEDRDKVGLPTHFSPALLASRELQGSIPHSLREELRNRKRNQTAFTMVEIALSIAVVAFGMVAILGILPTGYQVQKDNREDTIINQDGNYLLEAIGSGSQGLTELSNYVESITLIRNNNPPLTFSNLLGRQIIGLLSTPKYSRNLNGIVTNIVTVTARVRAISGSAGEKGFGAPPDIAFRYLLTSEVVPLESHVRGSTNFADQRQYAALQANLHEIRLTFRWPVLPNGTNTGNGRRSFSSLVAGRHVQDQSGYFFQPYSYR